MKKTILIIFLYFLLPLAAFWRNFDITGVNLRFFHVDFIGYYFPDYLQGVQIMKDLLSGIPISNSFWDPYNFLGFPLLGAVDRVGFFYPVRTIFYFISSFFSFKYQVFFATYYSLFHLSLAAIFTYLFVRRCLGLSNFASFIAGIIYGFGGSLAYIVIFTNVLPGPAFLPLQLYFLFQAYRNNSIRHTLLAGLAITPIFLSGYTSTFIYNNLFIALFLFLYFVRNKESLLKLITFIIIANVVGIASSAVVLLPSIEIKLSAYRQQLNLVGSSAHSFNYEDLVNYFIPYLYGVGRGGTVFGYIGILSILFVFIGLRYPKNLSVKIFLFLGILFFILSLGNKTFLHGLAYKVIPFYSSFRFHAFLHYLVGFSLAALAAYGVSLVEEKKVHQTLLTNYSKTALLIFLILFLALVFIKSISPNAINITMRDEMVGSISISMMFAAISFFVLKYRYDIRWNYFSIIVSAVLIVDLFTLIGRNGFSSSDYDPRVFITASEPVNDVAQDVRDSKTRVYFGESTLRFNAAPEKIYQVSGFHGLTPQRYSILMNYFAKKDGMRPDSPLFDLLSVEYIFTTEPVASTAANLKLVAKTPVSKNDYGRFLYTWGDKVPPGKDIYTYENTDYNPRVYMVTNWRKASTTENALLLLDKIDIKKTAVITTSTNIPSSNQDKEASAQLLEYDNTYIKAKTNSLGDGLLVLTDLYYPGWEAYIDGKRTTIHNVNIALRGIFVTGGKHIVDFKYIPKNLYLGMGISILSLISVLLFLIKRKR